MFLYWSELVLDQLFSHHNLFYLHWGDAYSYAVTLQGNDVVLAGVDFLRTGNYTQFGGEAVFWKPRTDAGNNIVITGAGDDYVVTGIGNDVVDLGVLNVK